MLQIENLTFAYRRKAAPVLNDYSLTIDRGSVCGLLGRNGAGKSTLLYLISGLLTPKSGRVLFNGVNTRLRKPSTLNDIFILPEEFTLPPISMDEYVKLNSRYYPKFSMDDLYGNLETFELERNLNLGQLSMGQKKKAFMSFALACNTSLLLMDEPTNGLDIPGKSRFRKIVVSSMTDDRSIIISTHQVRDIDRILDHIIITESNKVLLNEKVSNIISKLRFETTNDDAVIARALYSQPSVEGMNVILRNDDDCDTEMNLESLFELSLNRPELINQIFASKEGAE
ncbi:MAG: ABC transporter ATP-binding protein [Muribaculaceae bacterium]|nr:ABC transporter ATP-binding protein [Muribaculaceae bacterium]